MGVALISSWGHFKQPERAEAVLELMQQAGVAPDSSTFTPLITSWGQAKQPERAEAVLELMPKFGVRADSKCLAAIARVRTQNRQSKPVTTSQFNADAYKRFHQERQAKQDVLAPNKPSKQSEPSEPSKPSEPAKSVSFTDL